MSQEFTLKVTDPTTLLSSDADVRNSEEAIKKFRTTGIMTGSNEDMWNNLKLVNSAVHPSSGEIIPKAFRMSAVGPCNIPLVFGMITIPSANVVATLVAHWANQTYNSACNYFNSAGAGAPLSEMYAPYGLAIGSACGIAYGMGRIVDKVPSLKRFAVFIPVLASAAASSSNLAFMRSDELVTGADVFDDEGTIHGKSVVAGQKGVFQTALSRCVMVPFAVILLPHVLMTGLEKRHLLPKSKLLSTVVQLSVIYACLQGALPATLAVFPQKSTYQVSELEPKFQALTKKSGGAVTVLYANKGL